MSPGKSGKPAPQAVEVTPPKAEGTLKALGGSADDDFNTVIANQVAQALWLAHADAAERSRLAQAAISAMHGLRPREELEGMLGAQMIATHNAAMSASAGPCSRSSPSRAGGRT